MMGLVPWCVRLSPIADSDTVKVTAPRTWRTHPRKGIFHCSCSSRSRVECRTLQLHNLATNMKQQN